MLKGQQYLQLQWLSCYVSHEPPPKQDNIMVDPNNYFLNIFTGVGDGDVWRIFQNLGYLRIWIPFKCKHSQNQHLVELLFLQIWDDNS